MAAEIDRPVGMRLHGRAIRLGYQLGSDAFMVLLDLASHAIESTEGIAVAASYREIGRRTGLSKDTVGRRICALRRVGVLLDADAGENDLFGVRRYVLRLDVAGIELDRAARLA